MTRLEKSFRIFIKHFSNPHDFKFITSKVNPERTLPFTDVNMKKKPPQTLNSKGNLNGKIIIIDLGRN